MVVESGAMSGSAPRFGVQSACACLALALPLLGSCGGRTSETPGATAGPVAPSCPPGRVLSPLSKDCVPYRIATGDYHTCLLLERGAVRCWGSNEFGQLGLPGAFRVGDDETPDASPDVNVGAVAVQIAAGHSHSCATLSEGGVRCWGHGGFGQLGHANAAWIGDDEEPIAAGDVDVGGAVRQVAGGSAHTCALLEGGSVRCWGAGDRGRLGYAATERIGDDEAPASVGDVDLGESATQIATGGMHTCALLTSGSVRCWGDGEHGQLGYQSREDVGDDETPASLGDVDVGGRVVQVSTGIAHTCVLLEGGSVRCFGLGDNGRLGYGRSGSIGDDESPASAGDVDVGGPVVQIETGDYHTCALLASGSVRCWGHGKWGQLGYGNHSDIGDDEAPASAGDVQLGALATQIALGESHTCALLAGDRVRCFGNGAFGSLGHGNVAALGDDETPASAGDVPYL